MTDSLYSRGSTLSVRWMSSHVGVEGNEQADRAAKRAAEGEGERAEPEYLREASLAHLMRKTAEERAEATREWVRSHVGRRHRHRPPPGGRLRKGLAKTKKELEGRFYQLLSGHAATAEHLRRVGQSPEGFCWWYGSGERQKRFHLFVRLRRRGPKIRSLWKRVERDCDWGSPRAPSVRLLFGDARAAPAVLEFLEDTRMGRMPGRVLLAGGPDLDEDKVEEVELWAPRGGGGAGHQ